MIEKFINNFKRKHKDLEYLFTNGLCYQFTCILDKIFVGSIMYNDIDNHFAFLHNGKLYDITGAIDDTNFEHWDIYKLREPLNSSRITRSCIFLEYDK